MYDMAFKLFLILFFIFSSCSQYIGNQKLDKNELTMNNSKVYLTNNVPVLLAPFFQSLIKNQGVILHKIQGDYQGKTFLLDGVLKIDENSLQLVALTPISRLFSISLNKDGSFKIDSNVNEIKKNPQYIIMDLCLIYLPINDLKNNIPIPYKIIESDNVRTVFFEEMPIVSISYDANNHLISNIQFNNLLRNYSYNIMRVQ